MSNTLLAMKNVGIIFDLIVRKEIPKLHAILRGLVSDGVLSREAYEDIIYDLAEAIWLEGEELRKKAKEIEKKIRVNLK